MSDATMKIVIVAGQEFSVPSDTANETIRETLKANFPDVATATVQEGTREVGGAQVATVEFVKKAGTKGLTGADLAELLREVPATDPPKQPRPPRLTPRVKALLAGELTFAGALEEMDTLLADFELAQPERTYQSYEGTRLCSTLDALPAVAAPVLPLGW